jgi:hypothetical protein
MADVPTADAGLGSGIVNVSMQMAAALGLAVLGTVATNHTRQLIASGHPEPAALTAGYQLAFLIAALCVGVGTLVALFRLDGPPRGEDRQALRAMELENAAEPMAT